ncbi:MAG: thioredoxin [Clostridia bacterium]|jgi:thioredoxin 1|nr:thioredoxin [Clostridia bacterium]
MSKVLDILKKDFETEVLKSELPVLVDFWAPWCMPCRMMAPILDELADALDGKFKIVKIDTENPENQDLAVQYQIQSIPNMKLFKGGQVITEFVGMRSKDDLKSSLEKYL